MKNVININSFFAGPNGKPKPDDPNYMKKDKGVMQLNQLDNKFGKDDTSSKKQSNIIDDEMKEDAILKDVQGPETEKQTLQVNSENMTKDDEPTKGKEVKNTSKTDVK